MAAQQLLIQQASPAPNGATSLLKTVAVSTSRYGTGELQDSYQTPRGLHHIAACIGAKQPSGRRFMGRVASGEIVPDSTVSETELAAPQDYILTRILRLSGREPQFNAGTVNAGTVNAGTDCDSFARYIYLHATPYTLDLGTPMSHGCIRLSNTDMLAVFSLCQQAMNQNNEVSVYIFDADNRQI